LSKRHGAASVLEYRDKGYLPEALLNYLVRLGWSHGDQEIFSIDEMIALFDIANVNKSAAALNPDKLLWLNQHYLKESDGKRLAPLLRQRLETYAIDTEAGPALEDLCEIQKERVKTLEELALQSRYFYEDFSSFDQASAKKHLRPVVLAPFESIYDKFSVLEEWSSTAIHQLIEEVAASYDMKLGKIAQPLRVAVTGVAVSPSIDVTIALIGKERVLQRLKMAIAYIKARSELDRGEGVT